MAESMPPSPAPFKISVDLGTNPRSQSISHYPLEVEQVVLDISQWLKEHAAADALDKVCILQIANPRAAPLVNTIH